MEKQNKKFGKKEGESRISVRPGNFIVPGEHVSEPKQTRPAERSAPREENAAQVTNGGKRHNRRRGNRRGRGHGHNRNVGAPEQQNAAKNRQAPAEKKQGGEEKAHQSRKEQRDRRHQNKEHGRQGGPERRQNNQASEIGETLQRELDAQLLTPTAPLSYLSPVQKAEKKAAEATAVDTKEFEVDIATAAYLLDDVPCGFPVPDGKAVEVIGVRFRGAGKIYFFAPGSLRFRIGEAAIVDTARGEELGEVVMLNRKMAEKDIVQPLRSVLRRATKEDVAHDKENREKEREALKICAEKIAAHKLDMSLVDAQYTFDNSKLLFYFTAEGRVDFRELVRDLAGLFRTRIELRQIGIRDEARLIGGLGMCGRPFCCATHLSDFGQVSVKMAKEQGLSINTSKISGCCGRLMCCLRYEHESYAKEAALTPKKDTPVNTPDGKGVVVDSTPLAGTVKVKLEDLPDEQPRVYHRDKVVPLSRERAPEPASEEKQEESEN